MKTLPTPDARPILTPEEAGHLLGGMSPHLVVKLMESGELRSVNNGTRAKKYRRTSAAWVEEFKAGRRGQTVGNGVQMAPNGSGRCPIIGLQFGRLRS